MSRRKHTIRREAGLHLTDRQREMLGTAWNGYVNRCARISLRHFARVHNIPYSTWQRELRRGAAEAKELGHREMDTVISGRGSRGGLLVMLDRCSRRYVIEHLSHISQDEVVKAIRKMKARKALPVIRSVTTDNGCEFLSQKRIDRVFKAETYYTRAYASYEKGAIENCNRLT